MLQLSSLYSEVCRQLWVSVRSSSPATSRAIICAAGLFVIMIGIEHESIAQAARDDRFLGGHRTVFNDDRLADAINAILTYLEGTFGAMIMVAAGIGAILSAAFGQYRAALGLLVVAVGAFILRSLIGTFFNDVNIQP